MNISFQNFFQIFYLMFPICNKKDFENFLILSMIVGFALTLLSRGSSSWTVAFVFGAMVRRAWVVIPEEKRSGRETFVRNYLGVVIRSSSSLRAASLGRRWPRTLPGSLGITEHNHIHPVNKTLLSH